MLLRGGEEGVQKGEHEAHGFAVVAGRPRASGGRCRRSRRSARLWRVLAGAERGVEHSGDVGGEDVDWQQALEVQPVAGEGVASRREAAAAHEADDPPVLALALELGPFARKGDLLPEILGGQLVLADPLGHLRRLIPPRGVRGPGVGDDLRRGQRLLEVLHVIFRDGEQQLVRLDGDRILAQQVHTELSRLQHFPVHVAGARHTHCVPLQGG